jgi:hypothetical protein
MFIDPNELLEVCCRFLDEYKTFSSPEAFLDEVKSKKVSKLIPNQNLKCKLFNSNYSNVKNLGKEDYRYISDVCFGCLDKKNVLNPVVNGFYSKDGRNVFKSERSLYLGNLFSYSF